MEIQRQDGPPQAEIRDRLESAWKEDGDHHLLTQSLSRTASITRVTSSGSVLDHRGSVPDGRQQIKRLSMWRRGKAKDGLWHVRNLLVPIANEGISINSVAFSSRSNRSKRVAIGTSDGRLRILESKTGAELLDLELGAPVQVLQQKAPAPSNDLASHDGLASWVAKEYRCSGDEGIKLKGEECVRFAGSAQHTTPKRYPAELRERMDMLAKSMMRGVSAVAFAPDGKSVAAACEDRKLRIIDAEDGAVRLMVDHESALHCVAFDEGGSRLATGCEDGSLRILNAIDGAVQHIVLHGDGRSAARVCCVAFDPDGSRVATVCVRNMYAAWMYGMVCFDRAVSTPS